jgi:hypothetical protein
MIGGLECWNGTESLLDRFHGLGRRRGFQPATVVGTRGNDSDWPSKLVAGISQRLVLDQNRLPPEASSQRRESVSQVLRNGIIRSWFFAGGPHSSKPTSRDLVVTNCYVTYLVLSKVSI